MGAFESLKYFCPEATLSLTVVALLLLDLFLKGRSSAPKILLLLALAGIAASAAGGAHLLGQPPRPLFAGMVAFDGLSTFFLFFFLVVAALGVLAAWFSSEVERSYFGEYLTLLVALTLGMTLLAKASNLLMIYLSMEFVSILSYTLTGWRRKDRPGSESALKYVIYGSAASGVMLYGMSLLYGLGGTLDLATLQANLGQMLQGGLAAQVAVVTALILTLAGFLYKVAAAPFHMWCPDVYQGAPTPFTAFLSVGPKAAGFAVLMRFFFVGIGVPESLAGIKEVPWPLLLAIISAATMTIGNLVALPQTNVKRMLAYSSIAHAGYLMMGLAVATASGCQAVLFYLGVYMLMNMGAFLVVVAVHDATGSDEIAAYKGLGSRAPLLAILMAVFLFSLVGLPPLAGFIGKFYLFSALLEKGEMVWYVLALVGIVNSAISLYYYAGVVRSMFLDKAEASAPAVQARWGLVTLLMLLALPILFLGICWSPLAWIAKSAWSVLGVG